MFVEIERRSGNLLLNIKYIKYIIPHKSLNDKYIVYIDDEKNRCVIITKEKYNEIKKIIGDTK